MSIIFRGSSFAKERKRFHNDTYDENEKQSLSVDTPVVDDLQFASLYATTAQFTHIPAENKYNNNNNTEIEKEETDDESDVDLTHALQQMEEDHEEEEEEEDVFLHGRTPKSSGTEYGVHPKSFKSVTSSTAATTALTQHEIDLFNCPIMTLQKQLDFNLQVDTSDLPPVLTTTIPVEHPTDDTHKNRTVLDTSSVTTISTTTLQLVSFFLKYIYYLFIRKTHDFI